MFVKIGKYLDFRVYCRSYLLWSPVRVRFEVNHYWWTAGFERRHIPGMHVFCPGLTFVVHRDVDSPRMMPLTSMFCNANPVCTFGCASCTSSTLCTRQKLRRGRRRPVAVGRLLAPLSGQVQHEHTLHCSLFDGGGRVVVLWPCCCSQRRD